MTGDNAGTVAASLMVLADSILPLIEWAEGQKALLVERGWSEDTAEAFGGTLLLEAAALVFKSMTP
jgi:hypothetical protein